MRPILGLMVIAALAGCAKSPQPRVATTLAGALGVPEGPAVSAANHSSALAMSAADVGSGASGAATSAGPMLCDAPSLAYLVGRPRTEIPVPADLSRRRVSCATCPPPDDRRPDRTDILFNEQTGVIVAVTCG